MRKTRPKGACPVARTNVDSLTGDGAQVPGFVHQWQPIFENFYMESKESPGQFARGFLVGYTDAVCMRILSLSDGTAARR